MRGTSDALEILRGMGDDEEIRAMVAEEVEHSRALELLHEAGEALDRSYDACEWPADGSSEQERVRDKILEFLREVAP